MPRKRVTGKVRVHRDWRFLLEHGPWTQLGVGPELVKNFETEDEARAAWEQIGAEIIAWYQKHSPHQEPWGLEKFGPPKRGRHA